MLMLVKHKRERNYVAIIIKGNIQMVQIIMEICIIIILYMATGHILTCIWRNVFFLLKIW